MSLASINYLPSNTDDLFTDDYDHYESTRHFKKLNKVFRIEAPPFLLSSDKKGKQNQSTQTKCEEYTMFKNTNTKFLNNDSSKNSFRRRPVSLV